MFERAAQVRTDADITAADFFTKAMLASAAAWSPNPKKPPLYIDLPLVDGKLDPDVLARWTANAPNVMLHQYLPALRTCKAIGIEAGEQDQVAVDGSKQLHALLRAIRLPTTSRLTRATMSTASMSGSRPGSCRSLRHI